MNPNTESLPGRASSARTMNRLAFQRRHFEFMAMTIAGIVDPANRINTAQAFANRLGRTNAGFDRAKFLAWCGVPMPEFL